MNDTDIEKLSTLLKENRFKEAKDFILSGLGRLDSAGLASYSKESAKKSADIGLIMTQMRLMTVINERYSQAMEEVTADLESIQKDKAFLEDQLKARELSTKIAGEKSGKSQKARNS